MFKQIILHLELKMYVWVNEGLMKMLTSLLFPYRKCEALWWRNFPYPWHLKIHVFAHALSFIFHGSMRKRDSQANINMQWVKPGAKHHAHLTLWAKKRCLEKAFYFHNKSLLREVKMCAVKLQAQVEVLRATGTPVIFAPMHTISDMLAAMVCGFVTPGNLAIISSHKTNSLGPDEAAGYAALNMTLVKFHPVDSNPVVLKQILRSVKNHSTNLLVYPDVLPEVTERVFKKSMRTTDCKMFDRPAKIHSGLSELSRMAGATVIFFCLFERDGKLDIDILDQVQFAHVPEATPNIIQRAITSYPYVWLLWHSPSFFYFNSANR